MKISIRPKFEGVDRGDGGIRRWVEAQHRWLPEIGIGIIDKPEDADLIVCHAGDLINTPLPMVAHNHGLYNTADQDWSRWAWMLNAHVIEVMRRAKTVTVPSSWVADLVARGMSIKAHVLHAGIEPNEWQPGENEGYVLWNKTRTDPVCDPLPMMRLAATNPQVHFLSTFGQERPNVRLTGKLPYEQARKIIQHASTLLSTTKETFGIGTLEAMACGIPVLGWAWGGNLDIIKHLETGYLAEPGDYDELSYGLQECIRHRDSWGTAARDLVLSRFTWERAIRQCADLYRDTLARSPRSPKVSVVVTCYDLEQYLPDCLTSLVAQTSRDWECLVIDDCSPRNEECQEIVRAFSERDSRFRYLKTPQNLYLAGARNYGIQHTLSPYVLCLDADDMLNERAIEVLSGFLDDNPGIGITYGAFELIEPDGRRWISGWPPQFSWEQQMAHRNQLYYASMYRRQVWERTGGYRERCQTAEDADFWCRATSYGFRAYRATDYPCLLYRNRPDSMSHQQADPDWTAWYPWARDKKLTPFGSVGQPPNRISWPVPSYDNPVVSFIIPVGPGHERLVLDALDSVAAQTIPSWEAIVINDSGNPLLGLPSWVKLLESPTPLSGPAVARNTGIAVARAEYFVCLDADDYLDPRFLSECLTEIAKHDCGDGYIYTDWLQVNGDETSELKQAPDFDARELVLSGLSFTVTALIPKAAWDSVGGFDASSGGWEDWDFFFALATRGYHGIHLPKPLFHYRYWSGQRREDGYRDRETNARALRAKWGQAIHDVINGKGDLAMPCASCARKAAATGQSVANPTTETIAAQQSGDLVLMEYVGNSLGTRSYKGRATGQVYRAGATESRRRFFVHAADADYLAALPELRMVQVSDNGKGVTDDIMTTTPLNVRQSPNRLIGVRA